MNANSLVTSNTQTHCRHGLFSTAPARLFSSTRDTLVSLCFLLVLTGGMLTTPATAQPPEGTAAITATTVNINTANAETLASLLKGVGKSRAQEIVRYRETYGRFASVEELTEVKGIGASTLDMNRKVITLE